MITGALGTVFLLQNFIMIALRVFWFLSFFLFFLIKWTFIKSQLKKKWAKEDFFLLLVLHREESFNTTFIVIGFPGGASGKEPTWESVPGSERSSGGGYGNALQYSCLEDPIDRGAWWATVYTVTKSPTQLKWLSIV